MKRNKSRLRQLAAGIGALYLLGALVTYSAKGPEVLTMYLAISGALLLAATAFERGRYRPRVSSSSGRWQLTGERFKDPSSGRLMEVRFNPETGERDYVEVESGITEPPSTPERR